MGNVIVLEFFVAVELKAKLHRLVHLQDVCRKYSTFFNTRPKPAYGRQGLDWIVGPGYSFVVFSTNKTMETNQKP